MLDFFESEAPMVDVTRDGVFIAPAAGVEIVVFLPTADLNATLHLSGADQLALLKICENRLNVIENFTTRSLKFIV